MFPERPPVGARLVVRPRALSFASSGRYWIASAAVALKTYPSVCTFIETIRSSASARKDFWFQDRLMPGTKINAAFCG